MLRSLIVLAILSVAASTTAGDANRLAHLERVDPYYVSRDFARLTTPQWIGEEGVEAVVVLAIDDMRQIAKYEAYLRPILDRLKQIDGRAPVSIMANRVEPEDRHLQRWLEEGISVEVHTYDHPCPLLKDGDFAKAKGTYDRCVELMAAIPNNRPVAYRMPCCDSLNTVSPRFFAEIFNRTTPAGRFLAIDTSVFHVFTANDPQFPRDLVLDDDGQGKFRKYIPEDRGFVNTIFDYPYPYVIGGRCWEFPCVTPSDWSAQHRQQPNNPRTVADWKAALDATVAKRGVFNLVFHPHGWIRNDQIVELIDHVVQKLGRKVKFLSFREAHDRLNEHLLLGQPLRAEGGGDNGVRLVDVNGDGHQDVLIGNESLRRTRLWSPDKGRWIELPCPARLDWGDVRFGIVNSDGAAVMLVRGDGVSGAWRFTSDGWQADESLWRGLELEGQPIATARDGIDTGLRLLDVDGDGVCEALLGGETQSAVFRWSAEERRWRKAPFTLPEETAFVDSQGRDAGLRLVDLDDDGDLDAIFSDERRYSLHLFVSAEKGWSQQVLSGQRGEADAIPMISRAGTNNGAWFHSRSLWVQNEDSARLPHLVDGRSFNDLLQGVAPEPKDPQSGLRSLKARDGFVVELVAAEPLVQDPVAFDWGPDGKLWVVQMGDYPSGLDGEGKPGGQVRFLEDTDGDGEYDRSTVFLDGLPFPTGVMPWRNGVLVTCAPDLLYALDTDGDGRADRRETLFTGFGEGNQQHRVNGLVFGLDNWVHCANGDSGGKIVSSRTGETIELGRRDFRIRPDDGRIEPQTGQSQFGRTRDDWNNFFGCSNSHPAFHFVLSDECLRRNPHFTPPNPQVEISTAPGAAPVFPSSRTLPRFNDLNKVNRFTSACGLCLYRDELFGPAFVGNSFVCEPVHNLVHREVLSPNGVTFSSRRAVDEKESEFLSSTDNWFRPAMARTGPDGALWIADMYRLVIEHPKWIPDDWQRRLDLRAGHDRGRIYRVRPVGKPLRKVPRFDRMTVGELVASLESPNGPQRDLAHMSLVWRADGEAVEPLKKLCAHDGRPTARLHALCALDGLDALSPQLLAEALGDAHPRVRRHAVRLAAPFASDASELGAALLELVDDPDPQVRLELACALGHWDDRRAGAALARLLGSSDDEYLRAGVWSSALPHLDALVAAISDGGDAKSGVLAQLFRLAAATDNPAALARLAEVIQQQQDRTAAFSATAGMLDALAGRGFTLRDFYRDAKGQLRESLDALKPVFDDARQTASDHESPAPARLAAIGLLGRGLEDAEADIDSLGRLLDPRQSLDVQLAAAQTLGRLASPDVPQTLLRNFKSYGPRLRRETIGILLSRKPWRETLREALLSGQLNPGDFDAAARAQLLRDADEQTKRLFATDGRSSRQDVVRRFASVLQMEGDASRGAQRFAKRCESCHRLQGKGHAIGPDLMALTDKSPEALLRGVLDPNRAAEAKFLNYVAVTADGRTFTGMLASETGAAITLVENGEKRHEIPRAQLEALESTGKSLMPEGLEKDLSAQDLADVIRYVRGFEAPSKMFPGHRPEVVRPEALRGEFWLLASNCRIYGETLVFEPKYRNLGYWKSPNDRAIWTLEVERPGDYRVTLEYACPANHAGQSFYLESGESRLVGRVGETDSWDDYRRLDLGRMDLPAGRQRLTLRPAGALSGPLMDLKSVRLQFRGK